MAVPVVTFLRYVGVVRPAGFHPDVQKIAAVLVFFLALANRWHMKKPLADWKGQAEATARAIEDFTAPGGRRTGETRG